MIKTSATGMRINKQVNKMIQRPTFIQQSDFPKRCKVKPMGKDNLFFEDAGTTAYRKQ